MSSIMSAWLFSVNSWTAPAQSPSRGRFYGEKGQSSGSFFFEFFSCLPSSKAQGKDVRSNPKIIRGCLNMRWRHSAIRSEVWKLVVTARGPPDQWWKYSGIMQLSAIVYNSFFFFWDGSLGRRQFIRLDRKWVLRGDYVTLVVCGLRTANRFTWRQSGSRKTCRHTCLLHCTSICHMTAYNVIMRLLFVFIFVFHLFWFGACACVPWRIKLPEVKDDRYFTYFFIIFRLVMSHHSCVCVGGQVLNIKILNKFSAFRVW